MLGSEIIEVAIGLVLVFLLVSVICSAVREGIESWMKTRAAYLERGIRELLHDREGRGLARSFYEHPLVYGLYSGRYSPGKTTEKPKVMARGGSLPSYIPASVFANTMMDIAARGPDYQLGSDLDAPRVTLANIRKNILDIDNAAVRRVLLNAVDSAQGDLDRAREYIQEWYDGGMDRVSGWYKRSTQKVLFGIGLIVAVVLNINTLTLVDYLWRHDSARTALVARAEAAAATESVDAISYQEAREALDSLRLPIGWAGGWAAGAPEPLSPWDRFGQPFIGWLITALAATTGAPFWFDILNRVMVIRSTVKPREKSPEEGSEDRQPKKPKPHAEAAPPPPVAAVIVPTPPTAAAPPTAGAPPSAPTAPGPPADTFEPVLADGCDIPITRVTRDEDLPPAEGGVG